MRMIDIITIRKNKFNEDRKNPSFTDFWQGYHEGWYNAYKDLEEILEQKGLDAVPVVRCKDCKHWNEFMNGRNGKWFGDCKLVREFRSEDDYCSYGERKDGDV